MVCPLQYTTLQCASNIGVCIQNSNLLIIPWSSSAILDKLKFFQQSSSESLFNHFRGRIKRESTNIAHNLAMQASHCMYILHTRPVFMEYNYAVYVHILLVVGCFEMSDDVIPILDIIVHTIEFCLVHVWFLKVNMNQTEFYCASIPS